MEQNKILEILLARMDADKAERDASQEGIMAEMKVIQRKINVTEHEIKGHQRETKADKEEMMATIRSGLKEMINAITSDSQESTEACEEKVKALPETTGACPEVTPDCLEEEEQTPKETEAVEEPQHFPIGATDEEAIRANEDRTGEQRLAVRRHRQRKKRAQVNGGPRQKLAASRGRFTRRAVPALRKGQVHKGPGRTLGGRMTDRGLKQRQAKNDAV
jgi:seryl-tRNA synthetase